MGIRLLILRSCWFTCLVYCTLVVSAALLLTAEANVSVPRFQCLWNNPQVSHIDAIDHFAGWWVKLHYQYVGTQHFVFDPLQHVPRNTVSVVMPLDLQVVYSTELRSIALYNLSAVRLSPVPVRVVCSVCCQLTQLGSLP